MKLRSSAQSHWPQVRPVALLVTLMTVLGGCAEGIGGTPLDTLSEQPFGQDPAAQQAASGTAGNAQSSPWFGTAGSDVSAAPTPITSPPGTSPTASPSTSPANSAGAPPASTPAATPPVSSGGSTDGSVVSDDGQSLSVTPATPTDDSTDSSDASPTGSSGGSTGGGTSGTSTTDPGTQGTTPTAPATATCDDGQQNGDESDVDCGGTCPACTDTAACRSDNDCASDLSCAGGRCSAPAPVATADSPDLASTMMSVDPEDSSNAAPSEDTKTCGNNTCGRCPFGRRPCCTLLNRCGCALTGLLCMPSLLP